MTKNVRSVPKGAKVYDQSVLYEMSFLELVGAVFIRSQLVEQLMRKMILEKKKNRVPKNFDRLTFGQLLGMFGQLYPQTKTPAHPDWPDMTLFNDIKTAKDVRDDAAHGDFLAHLTIEQLLPGQAENGSMNRLTMKAARESVMVLDDALFKLWQFRHSLGSGHLKNRGLSV